MELSRIIMTISLVASLMLTQQRAPAEPTGDVLRSDVGPATVHGTTRGHQRKVVYRHGAWLVAYSNEQGSHLRISRDGLQWTKPLTFHSNKTSSSYTLVPWNERLFLFYTGFKPDSSRRQWKGDGVVAREVVVRDQAIELKGDAQPVLVDPQGTDFYFSAAVGSDGTFWVQSRHVNRARPQEQLFQDTRLTRTATPGRLTEWTLPSRPIPVQAKASIVPLVVPLPDGKAYAFARTYREVKTKANRLLGNLFDGEHWSARPTVLALMSDVEGDDRRMSAVLDAKSGAVHLLYIDAEGALRHRRLSAPYGEDNWRPLPPQPGTLVHPAPVHCAVASLDRHLTPSRVCVVFGRELQVGRDPRQRTGELRLAVFDGSTWTVAEQLVSEPGSTDNWYPNVAAEVSPEGELGVLYLQGLGKGPYRARFALPRVRPRPRGATSQSLQSGNASGIWFSERFDDAKLLKRGWYDGEVFKISAKDAYRGKGCIEFRWKEGGTKPVGSSGIRRLFQPTEQVYIRYYIKLSPGWEWTNRPYHPHLTHFLTTENGKYHGPAASHLTLYVEPVNGRLRLAATDIQNKDAPHGLTQGPLRGGYNGRFYDSKRALFGDASWHCVEAMFKLNSLDMKNDKPNADGEVRGWFDGKQVVERTDVVFRSTDFPKMKFNQFLLTPYFGPRLLPHAQTLWIDELAVGTKRIGSVRSPTAACIPRSTSAVKRY